MIHLPDLYAGAPVVCPGAGLGGSGFGGHWDEHRHPVRSADGGGKRHWQKNKAQELASGGGLGGYTVYNLTVADDHTFFVGTIGGGTWVHNARCLGLGKFDQPNGDGLGDWANEMQKKTGEYVRVHSRDFFGDHEEIIQEMKDADQIIFNSRGVDAVRALGSEQKWIPKPNAEWELRYLAQHPELLNKTIFHF